MSLFLERFKYLLENSEKKQIDIAKDIGISKQKLSNWKTGYNEPNLDDIIQIATYFNVSSDFLIGLENYDGTKADIKSPNITPVIFNSKEEPKPRMIPVAARSRGNKVRNLELSEEEIRKIQASRIRKITDDDDI